MIKKKMMLWACVTLLPFFSCQLAAQVQVSEVGYTNNTSHPTFGDTLLIQLSSGGRVLITGLSLMELKELGTHAEKIKTLFVNDLMQAINNKQILPDAEDVHYFVLSEQKRRLKAEAAEYTQNRVDVAYETNRLLLDLPKYHYAIHDIPHEMTVDIFVGNPDSLLKQLGEVSFAEAIAKAVEKKKLLRRYSKVEIGTDSNYYRIINKPVNRLDMLEFSPIVGVGLIGNTWSPVMGGQLEIRFANKYHMPFLKAGVDLSGFAFTEFSKGELTDMKILTSYNAKLLFNLNPNLRSGKPYWLGIQGGYINMPGNKTFNGATKFGFVIDGIGAFSYSFEYINHKGESKDNLLAFTIFMPF